MSNEELAPKEGETPDQFLTRIEDKKRELTAVAESKASEPELIQAPEPQIETDNVQPIPEDKPTDDAPAAPQPEKVDDKAEEKPKYAQKKGWKDADSFFESYRNLEREHSRLKAEKESKVTQFPPYQSAPMPPYTPPPSMYPQRPVAPNVEALARHYEVLPDEFEKVARISVDLNSAQMKQAIAPLMQEINRLQKFISRNDEEALLKSDPAFHKPEVREEMARIMETDKAIFESEAPLTTAFQRAVNAIGRKALEGSFQPSQDVPTEQAIPRTPPTTARGTGPTMVGKVRIGPAAPITPANFNALPMKEKEKFLKANGMWKDSEE